MRPRKVDRPADTNPTLAENKREFLNPGVFQTWTKAPRASQRVKNNAEPKKKTRGNSAGNRANQDGRKYRFFIDLR
jgi:hypothetical protein